MGDHDSDLAGGGYESEIEYNIRDQFNNVLPAEPLPLNEQFTGGITADYSGANWSRGNAAGATVNPTSWRDGIGVPNASGLVPTPVSKLHGDAGIPVDHFPGQWRVGSATVGSGLLVENYNLWASDTSCVWQRYRGKARHR